MEPTTTIFTLEEYSNLIDEAYSISKVIRRFLITTRLRAEHKDSILRAVEQSNSCFEKVRNLLVTMMEFDFPDSATVLVAKTEIRLQGLKGAQPQCCDMDVLRAVMAMEPNAINRVPHTQNELLTIAQLFLQLHRWINTQQKAIAKKRTANSVDHCLDFAEAMVSVREVAEVAVRTAETLQIKRK